MNDSNDGEAREYFRRSYTAADGLWFMKVEERYGFEVALEVDNEVWKVLPKIQARFLKEARKAGSGLDALKECLTAKLELDDFRFKVDAVPDSNGIKVFIQRCPWHDLMVRSGREHLSGKVGSTICRTEYAVWASEFGDDISFELGEQICEGAGMCALQFTQRH
jgi:hypothetical protein